MNVSLTNKLEEIVNQLVEEESHDCSASELMSGRLQIHPAQFQSKPKDGKGSGILHNQ